jgi:hypothetical protein
MSNFRAGAVAIKNVASILDAVELLEDEVVAEIYSQIEAQLFEWATTEGLPGEFGISNGIYFFDQSWEIDENVAKTGDPHAAWYYIYSSSWTGDEITSLKDLGALLGEREGEFEFVFTIHTKELPRKPKKAEFIAFCNKAHNAKTLISESGFRFADGEWHLPWCIDKDKLAECYEQGSIEDAMDPLKVALTNIKKAHPAFMEIVEEAKRAFADPSGESAVTAQ